MAIENFNEVKTYIQENLDKNEEVKNYVGGFVTADRVNSFLETDEGKKLVQPKIDSHFTKGLETWKSNNLTKLIDEEVKKRFPEAKPEEVELKKLQAEIAQMKNDALKKDLTNKTLKQFQEKKLPVELVDYILGADEETTNKNIEMLASLLAKRDEEIKTEIIKGNSYTPPNPKGGLGKEADAIKAEMQKWIK